MNNDKPQQPPSLDGPPMMPIPTALHNGVQPALVSLKINDLPGGGIMLEVATPHYIVYPFLSPFLMNWLAEQLRMRLADIVPASALPPSNTQELVELLMKGKKPG